MILLVIVVGPIIHVIEIKRNKDTKKVPMRKKQKQAYRISFSGVCIFVFAIVATLILLVIITVNLLFLNPSQSSGYALAFLVVPGLIVLVIGFITCFVPLIYSIPTVYKSVQKISNILMIIFGVIGFFTIGFIIFVLGIGIFNPYEMDQFDPFKTVLVVFFLAPILLIIGGVLGLLEIMKNKMSNG